MKALYSKLTLLFAVVILASTSVLGQKTTEKSRLDLGKNPKKSSFDNQNVLIKNNLPKTLKINTKASYTQYYRDLLIANNSKVASTKTVVANNNQELSTEKPAKNDKISLSNIYPNPANDYVTLDYKINGAFNQANITFFNLLGKEIGDFELNKNADKIKINTSSWESSIYMYQLVVDGKKISTKKLLVRHN